MKLKNILSSLAALAFLLLVQACDKPFEFDRPLAVSSRAVTLSEKAGSTHVMVYSNGPWTASFTEPVKWASLDQTSGEGINDVVFSYSANYSVSRQVGIVFTSGAVRDTVMMTQKGLITEASFLFDNSSLTLLRSEATVRKSFSSNLKYGLESIRSTVTYAEELADGDEEPVADFEKWISDVKVEKKAVSFKVSENKGELPRVAYIRFEVFDPAQSDGIPVNATLVVTQTTGDPELVFASAAEEVEGIAGEVLFATLSNNIWPYNDQIVFECEADWVSGIRLTSEGLILKVSRNDGTDVRSTDIRISFTDALGNKVEAIVRLTQVAYPLELTMENLRGMLSSDGSKVIDDFVYMDGYVVSDCTSPNIVSSPQTGQFMFDREYNYRVAYMQTKDGRYGIKLVFNDSEAAAIPRFSKLRLLVQGLTLTRVSDPVRYELSGITADNVIETQAGDMTSVAVKAKSLSELCDDDIYTYVNIPDMEVFCKDGAYANATDGYSLKDEVNPYSGTDKAPRWDVAPLLCTDINGNAAYMLTNAACTWRRGPKDLAFNTLLPQGSGTFKAIVVHEEQPSFRYGDLGRYQLRYMTPDDLAFNDPAFSNTIVEWNWNDRKADILPEIGNGSINVYSATVAAASDFNNTYNGRSGDGGNGGMTSNQKGLVANGGIKFTNSWWDFGNDTGRYFDISFSTAGISGNNLVFGIVWNHGAMGNTTLDSPAHWKLLYSVDGGASFKDVPDCEIIKNRSITWWTTTSQDSCPGFKDHLRRLPADCFGRDNVVLRLQVADKVTDINPNPKAVSDDSYLNFLGIEKGTLTDKQTEIRIGTITVRYN